MLGDTRFIIYEDVVEQVVVLLPDTKQDGYAVLIPKQKEVIGVPKHSLFMTKDDANEALIRKLEYIN